MNLEEVFDLSRIKLLSSASTSEEVLSELVLMLPDVQHDTVLEYVKERESQVSTGIGNEIAIPHCRFEGCKKIIGSIVSVANPVDFNSLDGQKVTLFFLIVGNPSQSKEHIKILGKISRIAKSKEGLQDLFNSKTPSDFFHLLKKFEAA